MTSIVLWVSDISHEANFYSALLDAPITNKSDEFISVENSENKVLLHLLPQEFRHANASDNVREDVAIKPIFQIASIEAIREKVLELGGRFPSRISSYDGVQYLDCIDPEGNVIQLSN